MVCFLAVACAQGARSNSPVSGRFPDAAGVFELETRTVSSLYGGRVKEVLVREGDSVTADQILVVMDTSMLDHQIAVAQAEVALAQARLQLGLAGPRPGEISIAQAEVALAHASRVSAEQVYTDTLALRQQPQELLLSIAVAEQQVRAAQARLESAVREKDAAELLKRAQEQAQNALDNWQLPVVPPDLPDELKSATWSWWSAWVAVNAAQAKLDGAKATLAHLEQVRADPLDLNAQVDLARAAAAQAAAQEALAVAQLELVQAGPTREQMEILEQGLAQAKAALQGLEARRQDAVIRAPAEGQVHTVAVRVGEVIAANTPLVTVTSRGSDVTLVMFIGEASLGQVTLGQQVTLEVDAFPDRLFFGRVTWTADEAQFTPRTVATKDQRVNTVFEVRVQVPNPDGLLRSGMTADVYLGGLGESDSSSPSVQTQVGRAKGSPVAPSGWAASGVIQASEVRIAAETSGLAKSVLVSAADRVEAGAPLIELSNTDLEAQVEQARAALSAAEAEARQVNAGPTREQVAVAQAQVTVTRAERDRAYAAWQAAQRQLTQPQDLQGQVVAAESAVALAEQQVELSKASLEKARSDAQGTTFGSLERQVYDLRASAAEWRVAAAEADQAAAQANLKALQDMIDNPLALQAKADRAKGDWEVAQAACAVSAARLADLTNGATPEEKSAAQARLQVASTRLELAQHSASRLVVAAPLAGTVLDVSVHPQETVVAGATLMTLADLENLRLTVFVPQTQLGQVHVGQAVRVVVDSYPESEFTGRVLAVADEAEYTPRNVSTKDGRTNTVFAVLIGLANPDGRLKPGMSADVTSQD